MVSAMMNSHIASFFVGIANAGPTIGPVACPSMVKSAWLTAPPDPSTALKFHPKQQQHVYPKNIHEMPVARGGIQRAPSQRRLAQLADDINQPAQASQYMQCMGGGQHIEKRT